MKYIYKLICPISNKVRYVGQTNNLKIRLRSHLRKQYNKDFFEWIEYLKNNNSFPLIDICEACEDIYANDKENMWINFYNNGDLLNNTINNKLTDVSKNRVSYSKLNNIKINKKECINVFSEEHKNKIRNSQPNQKKILQFDLNGNFIKEWNNITFAAKELNLQRRLVGKVCCGERKQTGGFIFKFKKND